MPNYSDADRILALAGVFQASQLVINIAHKGVYSETALETMINSLFKIDADNVTDIYGDAINLLDGVKNLYQQLSNAEQRNMEQAKYIIALLHLEKKLTKNANMQNKIQQGIVNAEEQAVLFSSTHTNVIANLADLYKQTISTLSPRIMVNGDPTYLHNPDNINKIRALLLAGVRSAVLWRQCGGNRMNLLFQHSKIADNAEKLLQELKLKAELAEIKE